MKELNHPNLVTFKEMFMERGLLMIVMEYMDGGMLADVVMYTLLNEKQSAAIMREVVQGLVHLHSYEIVHRDIKSDNILLSLSGNVKLIDFGFAANVVGQTMRKTFAGESQS